MTSHNAPLLFKFSHGYLGVQLFFIISGFVILRTLERCQNLRDFALSRFARLYPAFLVSGCITLAVLFLLDFNPQEINSRDVVVSFVMASDLLRRRPVDPSYWTLGYEVLFYILAGVTYLTLKVQKIEIACIVWIAIGFAAVAILQTDRHRLTILIDFGVFIDGSWSNLFVLGMMIFLISQHRGNLLTVAVVAAALAMSFRDSSPSGLSHLETIGIISLFGLSVWGAAEGKLQFLSMMPLVFLGDISYSLYLVHQIAGYKMIQMLENAGMNANLAILATIIAAVGVASCLRRGVELPAQRAIKNLGRRHLRVPKSVIYPPAIANGST